MDGRNKLFGYAAIPPVVWTARRAQLHAHTVRRHPNQDAETVENQVTVILLMAVTFLNHAQRNIRTRFDR